ncbi:rolling circle replication protein, Rep63 protein, partial [Salmonella enterica subsp. enterica]|nr:rolling circle replication protein, Rep63 protein [Salmonella enterica subsp. enterica]
KGLKELLGIESKTDEEILEETDKDSIVIDELAFEVFQLISLHSMQANYLEFVELDYLDKGNRAKGLIEKLLLFEIERITQNANTT